MRASWWDVEVGLCLGRQHCTTSPSSGRSCPLHRSKSYLMGKSLFSPFKFYLSDNFYPWISPLPHLPFLNQCVFFSALSVRSFWLPVQRQVWLQYGSPHPEQASGRCGERGEHGLPSCSWTGADGQLHWPGLHNWGHRHLSGEVCEKLTTQRLCTKVVSRSICFAQLQLGVQEGLIVWLLKDGCTNIIQS